MTPEQYSTFLESLRVKDEGPEEMHGYKFKANIDGILLCHLTSPQQSVIPLLKYLIERIRRAESNAKPSTLLEDVKACVREGMRLEILTERDGTQEDFAIWDEFRRLSEASET